jgi:hypothetical protein
MQLNNTADLKRLRERIESALANGAGLASEQFVFKCGNIKFEGDGSSCKVQLSVTRKDARPEEERRWAEYAEGFGLDPTMIGKQYTRSNGELVEILGLCPNRPKYPVMVRNVALNRRYLITLEEVLKWKEAA